MYTVYAFDRICTLLAQKTGWNSNQYITHEKRFLIYNYKLRSGNKAKQNKTPVRGILGD